MDQTAPLGDNHTGSARAKERTEDMVEGTREFPPTSRVDGESTIEEYRTRASREGAIVGSVPPPSAGKTIKQMAKQAVREGPVEAMKDAPGVILLADKLGERLAFERTGSRLYRAVISKLDAYGSWEGGPAREDLEDILREEEEHFAMLLDVIEQMGGDPTAMTPSADIVATIGMGAQQVVTDPRTNLAQSLEAMMVLELADNYGWTALADMVRQMGHGDIADDLDRAQAEEERHVEWVRSWIEAAHRLPSEG